MSVASSWGMLAVGACPSSMMRSASAYAADRPPDGLKGLLGVILVQESVHIYIYIHITYMYIRMSICMYSYVHALLGL